MTQASAEPATPAADAPTAVATGGLLLVLPQLFHERDGVLQVEAQAANGLRLYTEHFDCITLAAGLLPEGLPLPPSLRGVPADALADTLGLRLVPLPRFGGYRRGIRRLGLRGLRAQVRGVRERLGPLIDEHRFLQFTPSRHLDDWGSLAAEIAIGRGRRYAVHTDRVQEQMELDNARGRGPIPRLRARVYQRLLTKRRHRAIRGAALGMFHGADCFSAYADLVPEAALIHNIHVGRVDAIDDGAFANKLAAAMNLDLPLRVIYAGRVDADKGPLDFAEALAAALAAGGNVEATWLGDGASMGALRRRAQELGLNDRLRLPGFCDDKAELLAALRDHHIMMFCHKVPESPRCLIEALVSGTALLGYDSAYSRDLIGEGKDGPPAGVHVARHDHAALGAELARLAGDRPAVVRLLHAAREAGKHFNDEDVFAHRCGLLKRHLGADRGPAAPGSATVRGEAS
ncbi:glycosyltransferase [Phycisphaera mikurensis]|uniref:Putative glycosyltransferase n=1 Tax=Phycisphaera mikurensis (strain NBRC 102666 / KCTC 22515 / FYK2301M01) TaxID=1142394 RepID=I0IHY0_PHYMF|nr:glycosyltransferase [Phycisphaera mikurensis]MBB6441108.1 glycosyltransferase involved in cell wall biosynthesis [Phycisphaera mikurensis]BAM04868.1 putative glycosyltransferase [Phycisphaera mikurensis NBRC 102666]